MIENKARRERILLITVAYWWGVLVGIFISHRKTRR